MSTVPDAPQAPPGAPPVITPSRVAAAVCLLVPIVAELWVSSYARLTPRLDGIPFFYWYQLLWVPLSAVFTVGAYLLITREEKQRKALRLREGALR
ncbi:hypothetical protein P3T36_002456 [Kitasatospora sp. MAP12-15]|uniref:DUF3311 domain-containing protein n=1 Tax=unclassified Kitasatospora TaxID=2633591 RepID=UPI002473EB1B|nr:DUF3311 domain-containing protein [Kitasatospora sp. MAP12-44]MDH6112737.1 hypothetical protein [Kitasatospora sp. MAP12-44]